MLKQLKLFIFCFALLTLGAACSSDSAGFVLSSQNDSQDEASPSDVASPISDEHAQAPNASDVVEASPVPAEAEVASEEDGAELIDEEAAARAAAEVFAAAQSAASAEESVGEADGDDASGDIEVVPGTHLITQSIARNKNPQSLLNRERLSASISAARVDQCLPIHFEDDNLKAAVARALGTNKVTRCNCDMEYIENYEVKSLEGLQYCTNLRELVIAQVLSSNSGVIAELDLRPLQHLSKLTGLTLWAKISNLVPLSGLSELQGLYVWNRGENFSDNHAQLDLRPLQHLSKLTALYLSANILSLNPLTDLRELQKLYIPYERLADRTSLRDLTNLKELRLHLMGDTIQNLEPLRGMGLQALTLDGYDDGRCIIQDISALRSLDDLRILSFLCGIQDLAPLRGMGLQQLGLFNTEDGGNSISGATLSSFSDLRELSVQSYEISDLDQLQGLTRLQTLFLSYNNISDLAPIYDLLMRAESLKRVHVRDNDQTLFPGNDLRRAQMNAHYLRQINAELATRNSED